MGALKLKEGIDMRFCKSVVVAAAAILTCSISMTALADDAKTPVKPDVKTAAGAEVKADTNADTKVAPTAEPKTKPLKSVGVSKDPACMTRTGSRIPVHGKDCAGFGKSYDNDDIKRTGATNAGNALRMLDSSISPSH